MTSESLEPYDAGLLSDYGAGNVEWWQDYIRAELGRAHDFYASQVDARPPAQGVDVGKLREAIERLEADAYSDSQLGRYVVTKRADLKAVLQALATPSSEGEGRSCTCHPDDAVEPCAQKYAASECATPSPVSPAIGGDQGSVVGSADALSALPRHSQSGPATPSGHCVHCRNGFLEGRFGQDVECVNGVLIDIDVAHEGWQRDVHYPVAPCHPGWDAQCAESDFDNDCQDRLEAWAEPAETLTEDGSQSPATSDGEVRDGEAAERPNPNASALSPQGVQETVGAAPSEAARAPTFLLENAIAECERRMDVTVYLALSTAKIFLSALEGKAS